MDNLAYVKEQLLNGAGIDEDFLYQCLGILNERKLDFGDIFFEHEVVESFFLEEGIIKEGAYRISSGVGVRGLIGEKTGFAYSDVIERNAVLDACRAARSISSGHNMTPRGINITPRELKPLYVQDNPLLSMSREQKAALLMRANEVARSADSRVDQVDVSLGQVHRMMLVANTDGTLCADVKPIVQFNVSVVMKNGDRHEQGSSAMGGAFLLDELTKNDAFEKVALDAVRMASVNLEAIPAPAGSMPVVLGAGWPAVLIHEAVGHGLEGDGNFHKTSAYWDKVGQKVASEACTIVDDGTIPNRRGSQSCDDEGTVSKHNVLIENGILKGFMHDRRSAMLMGAEPTGNGRRQNYSCLTIPRMTNTYMMPGKYKKEELIASLDKGIYAVNFSGGQVDTTSGRFVFSASEAYLVENGKITAPIKGATLIGTGDQTMQKVTMVADDLEFDRGIGWCGKAGQSVRVGIGQPTVKISEITVGGSDANGASCQAQQSIRLETTQLNHIHNRIHTNLYSSLKIYKGTYIVIWMQLPLFLESR